MIKNTDKLAIYEAPYDDVAGKDQQWREYSKKLNNLHAADRRRDAATVEGQKHNVDEKVLAPVLKSFFLQKG